MVRSRPSIHSQLTASSRSRSSSPDEVMFAEHRQVKSAEHRLFRSTLGRMLQETPSKSRLHQSSPDSECADQPDVASNFPIWCDLCGCESSDAHNREPRHLQLSSFYLPEIEKCGVVIDYRRVPPLPSVTLSDQELTAVDTFFSEDFSFNAADIYCNVREGDFVPTTTMDDVASLARVWASILASYS